MSEILNGYRLVEDVFNRNKERHGIISNEDTIEVISAFGFNETSPTNTLIGHICSMARERVRKIIEEALVYDDYTEFDIFMSLIAAKRNTEKE